MKTWIWKQIQRGTPVQELQGCKQKQDGDEMKRDMEDQFIKSSNGEEQELHSFNTILQTRIPHDSKEGICQVAGRLTIRFNGPKNWGGKNKVIIFSTSMRGRQVQHRVYHRHKCADSQIHLVLLIREIRYNKKCENTIRYSTFQENYRILSYRAINNIFENNTRSLFGNRDFFIKFPKQYLVF